jgi:polygalacturonase
LAKIATWVSGTERQASTTRDVDVYVAVTGDATNNAATCAIALSPDDTTFTTLCTVSLAAAINNTGAITVMQTVRVPAGWWLKLTLSHTTVADSYYA